MDGVDAGAVGVDVAHGRRCGVGILESRVGNERRDGHCAGGERVEQFDQREYLGGLATIFTAVHVVSIRADTYVHFGPVQVLVPFTASWRPGAVAAGVVVAGLTRLRVVRRRPSILLRG